MPEREACVVETGKPETPAPHARSRRGDIGPILRGFNMRGHQDRAIALSAGTAGSESVFIFGEDLRLKEIQDTSGLRWRIRWDSERRPCEVWVAPADGARAGILIGAWEYTAHGEVVSIPLLDHRGGYIGGVRLDVALDNDVRLASTCDANGRLTEYRYDEKGRVVEESRSSIHPDEDERLAVRYSYGEGNSKAIVVLQAAGRQERVADARIGSDGAIVVRSFWGERRVGRPWDWGLHTWWAGRRQTDWTFKRGGIVLEDSARGSLERLVVDRRGDMCEHSYAGHSESLRMVCDDSRRPVCIDAVFGRIEQVFDESHRPVLVSFGAEGRFRNTFDARGRLRARAVRGFHGAMEERYEYDEFARLRCASTMSIDGVRTSTEYRYNTAALVEEETQETQWDGRSETVRVAATFDTGLDRRSLAVSDGLTAAFEWSPLRRLRRIEVEGCGIVELTRVNLGDVQRIFGLSREAVKSKLGEVPSLRIRYRCAGGKVAYEWMGMHDGRGQRTSVCWGPAGARRQRCVEYDDAGRPIRVTDSAGRGEDYRYDEFGLTGRTSLPSGGVVRTRTMRRSGYGALKDVDGIAVHHSGNGALKGLDEMRWHIDYRGRIIQVRGGGKRRSCLYDAAGRLRLAGGGSEYVFVYDGWRIVQVRQGRRRMNVLHGEGINEILAIIIDEDIFVTLTDDKGTILGLCTPEGHVVVEYGYSVWGDLESVTQICDVAPAGLREFGWLRRPLFGFQGCLYDEELRAYWMGSRWYFPAIGQFGSWDPMWLRARCDLASTPYEFALSDPVNLADPLGMATWDWNVHRDMTSAACTKMEQLLQQKLDCQKMVDCNVQQDHWKQGGFIAGDPRSGGAHGMGSSVEGLHPDPEGAETAKFIAEKLQSLFELVGKCDLQNAMCEAGKMLHAVQDWHALAHGGRNLEGHKEVLEEWRWERGWGSPEGFNILTSQRYLDAFRDTQAYLMIVIQWIAMLQPFKKNFLMPGVDETPGVMGVERASVFGVQYSWEEGQMSHLRVLGHPAWPAYPFDGAFLHSAPGVFGHAMASSWAT